MAQTREYGQSEYPEMARCTPARHSPFAPASATPIWLAALIASNCHADRSGEEAEVAWQNVSGKALYTNAGDDTEFIHAFGVALEGGQTLAVSWIPGDTAYTVEVFN